MNNTLIKGLQLLEHLARSETALGVTELAVALDLGKSNVHRLLQALVELGYIQKNEARGTYRATLKLWELGTALEARLTIKSAAREAMEHLLKTTRETVHLSLLDGDEVVYIHKLDSPEPVRAYSEIGGRAPAHCVATGKAILAWQKESYLEDLSQRLVQHTGKTITKPEEFLQELERIRSTGYAVNRGEWRETVWGVASPILNSEGTVLAAIGVSGPAVRIKQPVIKRLAAEVQLAAETISAKLARS
ncbi:IclR family transcriptional regulator [Ottowia thiooxydans]|uniref:IclR family transcriptional regulator n=1 Tax=Ottowia thiooxydans TaxID=219182 RepID=UPI0004163FF2|nr:IclR family transcriptional regulator [Ottowia thiooxydans]